MILYEFDSWSDNTLERMKAIDYRDNGTFCVPDFATARYLSKAFSGFMTAPVVRGNDNTILEARKFKALSIEELANFIANDLINNNIYLYTLTYYPSMPTITKLNTETFEIEVLPMPIMTPAFWQMRYASAPNSLKGNSND